MQSVLILYCFICKVCLFFTALYAKCPYSLLLYMQSIRILYCFICNVSLFFTALYAMCRWHLHAHRRARAHIRRLWLQFFELQVLERAREFWRHYVGHVSPLPDQHWPRQRWLHGRHQCHVARHRRVPVLPRLLHLLKPDPAQPVRGPWNPLSLLCI